MAYFWTKTLHLVFVVAWMSAVFYLPRILVNLAESTGEPREVHARLVLMGKRLYRFGHVMFGVLLVFGLVLWLHFGLTGRWLHVKLALVALLLGYYLWTGAMLKRAGRGEALPTGRWLRWFNELPLLVFIAIVFLVLAKPF